VVVTETGENVLTSASRAIRRAKATIQRRVKQRRDQKTKATRPLPPDTDMSSQSNGTPNGRAAGVTSCVISKRNRTRLRRVIEEASQRGIAPPELLRFLEQKLAAMECLSADSMPGDIITMNSKFRLCEVSKSDVKTCVLRYPDAVLSLTDDLSVLAPLGATILGCREGDEVVVEGEGHGEAGRYHVVKVMY
jgi:regulator of nucleoside diphosphate kinase